MRFYDLMRTPITCPICHSAFVPPPVREIVLEAAPKKGRSVFHRPNAPAMSVSQAPEEKIEMSAADEGDDVETKIEPQESDAILELEDDADSPVVDPSLAESEKG